MVKQPVCDIFTQPNNTGLNDPSVAILRKKRCVGQICGELHLLSNQRTLHLLADQGGPGGLLKVI